MNSRLRRAGFLALVSVSGLAITACATTPPEPAEVTEVEQVTATVTGIDLDKRLVTLRSEDGAEDTFEVSPAVTNLAQVEVGDLLTVSYYEGLAAEVTAAAPEDEPGIVEIGGGRAAPGERPAGALSSSVSAIVTIENVDRKLNTVTFRGADGLVRAVDVKRPEMQQFIQGLKKGDKVRVTYSEALAVEVRPAK